MPGLRSEERRVGKECRSRCDWSSDVCSSDLLEEQGGWVNRDTAYAFAEYAEAVTKRLGDRVDAWITLNEPWCSAFLGYGIGIHAPGLQDRQAAFEAGHNLLLAHGLAVPRIRAHVSPNAQVGITL